MKNPLIELRESLGLSQRELADVLETSQQFIQRHEIGQASTLPNRIGDYFDYVTSPELRLNILGDLLVYADEQGLDWAVPNSYRPGTGTWSDTSRNSVGLYSLWVRLSRASLPDLSGLLTSITFNPAIRGYNAKHVQQALSALGSALGIPGASEHSERQYEVATALRIHPFVLSNFLKQPERLTDFPPAIRTALSHTKKVVR